MGLTKEIRENKWGIILGGVWGLVQPVLPQILPKGIQTTSRFLQFLFSFVIRDVILLPTQIAISVLSSQYKGELWGFFLHAFILSVISGIVIGYLISKIIKKVIK